jgi:hypothetical protein
LPSFLSDNLTTNPHTILLNFPDGDRLPINIPEEMSLSSTSTHKLMAIIVKDPLGYYHPLLFSANSRNLIERTADYRDSSELQTRFCPAILVYQDGDYVKGTNRAHILTIQHESPEATADIESHRWVASVVELCAQIFPHALPLTGEVFSSSDTLLSFILLVKTHQTLGGPLCELVVNLTKALELNYAEQFQFSPGTPLCPANTFLTLLRLIDPVLKSWGIGNESYFLDYVDANNALHTDQSSITVPDTVSSLSEFLVSSVKRSSKYVFVKVPRTRLWSLKADRIVTLHGDAYRMFAFFGLSIVPNVVPVNLPLQPSLMIVSPDGEGPDYDSVSRQPLLFIYQKIDN